MLTSIYSIKDIKTGIYDRPFFNANDIVAARQFRQAVNDPATMLSKYPQDFELWNIGEIDDDGGKITQTEKKVVCSALSVVDGDSEDQLTLLSSKEVVNGSKK